MLLNTLETNAQNVTITALAPVCNGDGILVASHSIPGGTFLYRWWTNEGVVTHMTTDLTDTLFNFKGGSVYLDLNMNGAFVDWGAGVFNFPFNIAQTVVADTCPFQTGSISLALTGGIAPINYSWTFNGLPFGGNTAALSNLSAGVYDCLISDAAGCQMYLSETYMDTSFSMNVPSVNNLNLTFNATPANCTNGTATVNVTGGQAPYSYLWSNGQTTQTATGLTPNVFFTVIVTDANGCISQDGEWITSNINIAVNTSTTPAHCTFSDGAITVIPTGGTGPYSYLWNTAAVTPTISNLPEGQYAVTVSDVNGCVAVENIYIIALTPVNVTFNTTPTQCLGATGSATAIPFGGITPYTYEWYTTPVQNTATATSLAHGSYNFKVTDSQGCIRTGMITVLQNTTLALSINSTPTTCTQNNGTATMTATGGSPPYSYLWSNGQTSAAISNLPISFNYGTVTDALGCYITGCEGITYNSTLNFSLAPQAASCLYTPDGSISVNIFSGTPPYTYIWSNLQTTPSISGLLPGHYWVQISDANGCLHYEDITLGYNSINPCTAVLEGFVYIDMNNDCVHSAGEPGMENIPIHCSTINETYFTDGSGHYSFLVPAGTITLQQLPLPYRYQTCPISNPFTVNIPTTGITVLQNIGDTVDWVNDLTVGIWNYCSVPLVGSNFIHKVVELNLGTQSLASSNQYDYDSQTPYAFATLSPSTFNPGISRATWDDPLFLPLNETEYNVTHSVPVTVPINTQIYFTDTIFPVSGDTTWWDNNLLRIETVVGSYDPNYKEVTPRGTGPQGYISPADSVLEYVIHFQNLGNYFAENIRVTDLLDSDLDPLSLRIIYATHTCYTHINAAGEVEFNFPNIYLPAAADDSIESNGFVVFTIHLKPNLADGTQIENMANIFFDHNPPVPTNTTLNTILITGIEEMNLLSSVSVFPNPNNGSFSVYFPDEIQGIVNLQLMNMTGQLVYEREELVSGKNLVYIDQQNLAPGIYFLQTECNGSRKNMKVVVK